MNPTPRRSTVHTWAPWACLAALVGLGLWLRLRAIPGTWSADGAFYAARALEPDDAGADPRSQRRVFLALVRLGLGLSDGRPAGGSFPAIAASAGTAVVLFAALRRAAGPWIALAPAAVWAVLGLDVEECVDVSSDAVATLPAALAALAIVAARARPDRALPALALGGLAVGAGLLVKETMVFPAAGLGVAALLVRPRPSRLRCLAAAAVPAIAVAAVAAAAGLLQRPDVIARGLEGASEPVRWDEPGFLTRLAAGPEIVLLTATGAFGLLHIAALPLAARAAVRALRGDPLCAAAAAALVAFQVVPVSFPGWGLLPASLPRFMLPLVPLTLAALADTLAAAPEGRWERRAAWAGAAAAAVFLRSGPVAWLVLPPAVLACVWTSLPSAAAARLPVRHVLGIGAVTLAAAAATSLATPLARTAPDPVWDAWPQLPATGAVHAQRPISSRLQFAARSSPDAARVVPFDDLPPPGAPPGTVVLVRRGTRAEDACQAAVAGGEMEPLALALGESRAYRRVR